MIKLENVTYTYPFASKPALRNVSLRVRPGEVILCTGVSGCGKTTLMRLVNGLCPHYYAGKVEGRILVNGLNNSERELHQISHDVGTLFQDPENQFFALDVKDEMAFTMEWQGVDHDTVEEKIRAQSKRYGLQKVLGSTIHELSQGQKQKLGLSTITMDKVRALILDEPTANLDPEATEELAKEIKRLRDEGTAVLVVDHRLYWLNGIADRVVVFRDGEIVREGDFSVLTDEFRNENGLRKTTVPDGRKSLEDVSGIKSPDSLLGFEDMHFGYKGREKIFEGADLSLTPGISALIGDNGAGKTTLARVLTGLNKAQKGTFFLKGRPVRQKDLLRHVAIVLQNADHQLHMRTVFDEVLTSLEASGRKGDVKAAEELLAMFDLSGLALRHPQSLSGGQKQRLVIACAFAKDPDVILLDEPTSGLDGVNMKRIASALKMLADQGKCVIVITHDLELMELCCSKAIRLPLKN